MPRLTPTGRIALVGALGIAALALLWPSENGHPHAQNGKGADSKCPLGFKGGAEDGTGGLNNPHVSKSGTGAQLTLFYNGTIWTGASQDHVVEALLVDSHEGSILATGPLERLQMQGGLRGGGGGGVKMVDLKGKFVMPGVVDPHVHLLHAGLFLSALDLSPAMSKEHFQQLLKQHIQELERRENDRDGQMGTTTHTATQEVPRTGTEAEGAGVGTEAGTEAEGAGVGVAGLGSQLWVLGGLWDESHWGGGLPDRYWLDSVTGPDRPALLHRMDLHMAVVNGAAMRLAGISGATGDPEGGGIDRDERGEPTGVLRESAVGLVARYVPVVTTAQLEHALQVATDYALSHGVTTVACMGRGSVLSGNPEATWQDVEEVLSPSADAGLLRLRVMAFTPLTSWQRLAAYVAANGRAHPSGRLFWGGLKEFADGSLGSRTALMWEQYTDADDSHAGGPASSAAADDDAGAGRGYGTRMIPMQRLYEMAQAADAAGLSVAVHAIGDRAVDEVVDVFRRVRLTNVGVHSRHAAVDSTNNQPLAGWFLGNWTFTRQDLIRQGGASEGWEDGKVPAEAVCDADGVCQLEVVGPRHRVEHMQHISGAGTARLAAQLGVGATPNPLHLVTDGELMKTRLGAKRAGPGHSYAFRSLLDVGMRLGMATDWPVVDLNPIAGIFVSAHRRDGLNPSLNTPVWGETEALPVGQAMLGHTAEAAYLAMMEDYVGVLRPGLRADLAIYDKSPLLMTSGQVLPQVMHTYVDGRCVYGCTGTMQTR